MKQLWNRIHETTIVETEIIFLDEIKNNDLMSEKYKKTCKYLNYFKHLLILASVVTGFVSSSAFASLVYVPVAIMSSAVGMKTWKSLQELKSINQL